MEVTKKIKNLHPGNGIIFIKMDDDTIQEITFYLDKNGKFYTGKNALEPYLQLLGKEINEKIKEMKGE